MKIWKLSNMSPFVLKCGLRSTTSVSLAIKEIKRNSQIWTSILKVLKLSSISPCVLRCGVRSMTSVSLLTKKWYYCQIRTFEIFYRESLKAIKHLLVCVRCGVRSVVSVLLVIKKLSEIVKFEYLERFIVKVSKIPSMSSCVLNSGARSTGR